MSVWEKVRHFLGSNTSPTEPASPRELFAAEVEAVIRQSPTVTAVRRKPGEYAFVVSRGDQEHTLFLDNVFAETRDLDPERRRELVARVVRIADAPDATAMSWDEVRAKLAPLLRTPSLFASVEEPTTDRLPIRRPFAPFLIECVGIDSDDGIAYATPYAIGKWGVEPSDVFAAATENGRAYFVDDVALFDPHAPYPIWHVSRDDSYESSRILVPGWLASFADKVSGRPVAIVPHRSMLIVGGDGDERCLRRLMDTAKGEFKASPRRISPALYTVDNDGDVVPLALSAGHPLAADVALGHIMAATDQYSDQKHQLEQRVDEEAFVAPYTGVRGKDGSAFSYTMWSRDVPSLLPRADQVALVFAPGVKGGETLFVPWEALVQIASDCFVQEPDLDPPRWRTIRWPEEPALEKLRAVAVRLGQ